MGTGHLDTTNQRYPQPGDTVKVVQKKDYQSGTLTTGVVKDVLTKKQKHPRGHKVRLENGIIGRVQEFVNADTTEEDETIVAVEFDAGFDLR